MADVAVSVVIATYNRPELLGRAIRSVAAQTYPSWELIVVDDGSDVDSRAQVEALGERATYLYQANAGESSARNHGLGLARGEYVAFLDDDDAFAPDKLRAQTTAFARAPEAAVVYSPCQVQPATDSAVWRTCLGCRPPTGDPFAAMCVGNFIALPGALARRSAVAAIGGFDPDLRFAEDWDLWLRVLAPDAQALYLDTTVADYHLHSRGYLPSPEHAARQLADHVKIIERALRSPAAADLDDSTRARAHARVYGQSALVQYALGLPASAAAALERAAELEPERWAAPHELGAVIGSAAFDLAEGRSDIQPETYIDYTCARLPAGFAGQAARTHRAALATAASVRSLRADATGDGGGAVRAGLTCLYLRPGSILDRGFLVRLARGLARSAAGVTSG